MDLNSSMTPPLCSKNCGFYGTKENKNMCSKCYKDFLKSQLITNAKPSTKSLDAVVQNTLNPVEPNPSSVLVDSCPTQSRTSSSESNNTTVDSTSNTATRVKSRCENCNKKVGLTGFKCRCGKLFCGTHRYPREHACTFDFKEADRKILVKNNPFINPDKLSDRI